MTPKMAWLISAFLVFANAAHAAPSGQIALVVGEEQETQQVSVYDLSTKQVSPVGPGRRDGAPVWSPDGTRLAFHTEQEGKLGIYVVNSDGSGGMRLTHAHGWNHDPRWSPDGKRVAYTTAIDDEPLTTIGVYDIEAGTESFWGGEQKGLMRPVFMPNLLLLLALQPDASEKALSDPVAEGLRAEAMAAESLGALLCVGVVGAPGKLSTELFIATKGFALPVLPLVPDYNDSLRYAEWFAEPNAKGERLAFESNDGGDREIFVLGKRGLSNVSNDARADWSPVWSPDGRSVAFESFRGGRRGVYRVFTDTARVLPVLAPANSDAFAPAWSPDGKYIACTGTAGGREQVQLVELKSGKSQPLDIAQPSDGAAWRPKPKGK